MNVFRMRLLGAEVVSVKNGTKTLKDAISEAMRAWVTCLDDTHYLFGTAYGPHPYPAIVKDFQSVIGQEARAQVLEKEGRRAGRGRRLRGRRQQRDRYFFRFREGRERQARRRGGRRLRHQLRKARRQVPDR